MELVLPEGGPITASLCDFLKQMHTAGTTATVSPSHLLRKVRENSHRVAQPPAQKGERTATVSPSHLLRKVREQPPCRPATCSER